MGDALAYSLGAATVHRRAEKSTIESSNFDGYKELARRNRRARGERDHGFHRRGVGEMNGDESTSASTPSHRRNNSESGIDTTVEKSDISDRILNKMKINFENVLNQKQQYIQQLEARLKKSEYKLKSMNQWKSKALDSYLKEPNYRDFVLTHDNAVIESTKVRFWRLLFQRVVARAFIRTYRTRKILQSVHSDLNEIISMLITSTTPPDDPGHPQLHNPHSNDLPRHDPHHHLRHLQNQLHNITTTANHTHTHHYNLLHSSTRLSLQSEINSWSHESKKLLRSKPHTHINLLLTNLYDVGPVLKCAIQEALFTRDINEKTTDSFFVRNAELIRENEHIQDTVYEWEKKYRDLQEYTHRIESEYENLKALYSKNIQRLEQMNRREQSLIKRLTSKAMRTGGSTSSDNDHCMADGMESPRNNNNNNNNNNNRNGNGNIFKIKSQKNEERMRREKEEGEEDNADDDDDEDDDDESTSTTTIVPQGGMSNLVRRTAPTTTSTTDEHLHNATHDDDTHKNDHDKTNEDDGGGEKEKNRHASHRRSDSNDTEEKEKEESTPEQQQRQQQHRIADITTAHDDDDDMLNILSTPSSSSSRHVSFVGSSLSSSTCSSHATSPSTSPRPQHRRRPISALNVPRIRPTMTAAYYWNMSGSSTSVRRPTSARLLHQANRPLSARDRSVEALHAGMPSMLAHLSVEHEKAEKARNSVGQTFERLKESPYLVSKAQPPTGTVDTGSERDDKEIDAIKGRLERQKKMLQRKLRTTTIT